MVIPRCADSREIAARHRTVFAIPIHLSNSPSQRTAAFPRRLNLRRSCSAHVSAARSLRPLPLHHPVPLPLPRPVHRRAARCAANPRRRARRLADRSAEVDRVPALDVPPHGPFLAIAEVGEVGGRDRRVLRLPAQHRLHHLGEPRPTLRRQARAALRAVAAAAPVVAAGAIAARLPQVQPRRISSGGKSFSTLILSSLSAKSIPKNFLN